MQPKIKRMMIILVALVSLTSVIASKTIVVSADSYYDDNKTLYYSDMNKKEPDTPTDSNISSGITSDVEIATTPTYQENHEQNILETIPIETIAPTISTQHKTNCIETNEYLYVCVNTLNVRIGPGTEYDIAGEVFLNDLVYRVGILENGWSKILYNNQKLYVYTDYLSYNETIIPAKPIPTVADEIKSNPGMIGRLYIYDGEINVALFEVDIRNGNQAQAIVDNQDSAAYMPDVTGYYGQTLIGDHVHQGFSGIKSSIPGKTIAIIDFGTHKQHYVCVKIFIGINTGHDLIDMNKVSISGKNNGGICMYTCNSDGTITITYWQPL